MEMKKGLYIGILAAALGIAAAIAGCASNDNASKESKSDANVYTVATRGTAKPFSYVDDQGNLTGYDVEILKEAERRDPSLHFEFKTMATDAAFIALKAGQVDIIANQIRRNPKRENYCLYTNEVNNYSVRKLAVRSDRNDIHSIEDLKGKKIAVTTSSEFNEYVEKFNETANPKIDVTYTDKGSAETLNLVATGRVDAAGEYEYIINAAAKDQGLPVKAVGKTLLVVPTYFVLRREESSKPLAEKLDKAVAAMRADGTLKKISEEYLGGDYTIEPAE